MLTAAADPNLSSFFLAFAVNLTAIVIFAVLMFFRRYTKPGLTVVFVFFNVGLFAVVTVIMRTDINAGVGFGLFAMLSIIRLRSDPFSPREIGYFFGALAIGLINGLGPPDALTLALNVAVLATMYVVDHPRLFVVPPSLEVTFDRVIADPIELRRRLEERLGMHVRDVTVSSIDYVRDIMDLKVQYLPTGRMKGSFSSRGTSAPRPPAPARPTGAHDQPASREARTLRPSPAAPAAGFQGAGSARVAAPVAAAVAARSARATPSPAVSPAPSSAAQPAAPSVGGPAAPAASPAAVPPAGGAPVPIAGTPAPPAPPALPTSPGAAAPERPEAPSPTDAEAAAQAGAGPARPVFAPVAPVTPSVPANPVFAPGVAPQRPGSPVAGSDVPAAADPAVGPETSDLEPGIDLDAPADEAGDDRLLREKVVAKVSSWIVS